MIRRLLAQISDRVAPLRELPYRVGRRGVILLMFGQVCLFYGGASLLAPATPNNPLNMWLDAVAPIEVWAATWLVGGLLCLVQAFKKSDKLAYQYAAGVHIGWIALMLVAWLAGGVETGWRLALWFLPFAGVAMACSGWPEPLRMLQVRQDGER